MKNSLTGPILFFLILLIAAGLRFYNLNWDQNQHLHPDERFLTMVGNAMIPPATLGEYLDPLTSKLNPTNLNFPFYVYGTLPVVLNKYLAVLLHNDSYNEFTVQGRFLSGLADLITLIFVFKIAGLLAKRYKLSWAVKYWAMGLYASAVLPIQLSHFFAVDTFLNCFLAVSFYFALRYYCRPQWMSALFSGLFLALAISAKISAVYMAPLMFGLLLAGLFPLVKEKKYAAALLHVTLGVGMGYVTLRLASPYLFASGSMLDLRPNPVFLQSIRQLQSYQTPAVWFPPSVQWLSKQPVLFSLVNTSVYGLGVVVSLLFLVGTWFWSRTLFRSLITFWLIWGVCFFIYQGAQLAQTMRYFIVIYPLVAVMAALGVVSLLEKQRWWLTAGMIVLILLWPAMFMSIYIRPQTRLAASTWIYSHIPENKVLLAEHWDDALPLPLPGKPNTYIIQQLPVFDRDTDEKWTKMTELISQGDYLIESSNRAWGSIPLVPDRYPRTSQFYTELESGRGQFKKIAEFSSFPSLTYLGLPFTLNDSAAEEAFSVYDHPQVFIFQKVR